MIEVAAVTGFVTVQDQGWPAGRAIGLPRSGALDAEALVLANALVGNQPGAAGLEVALGGLKLDFCAATTIAHAGAVAIVRLNGAPVPALTAVDVQADSQVTIGPVTAGRFTYLATRGGIDVPLVLGSRSTYLPTGLGGLAGRRLREGDRLHLGDQVDGPVPTRRHIMPAPLEDRSHAIGIIRGPQADLFSREVEAALESDAYVVSPHSDRMGTRLVGAPLRPRLPARFPSEGTCLGAIQVPDDGQPIVILADGPTVGGYPKLGAVASADLGRFVQTPVGGAARFRWIGVAEAQRALYQARERLASCVAALRAGAS